MLCFRSAQHGSAIKETEQMGVSLSKCGAAWPITHV
jgi:hypothetical protein